MGIGSTAENYKQTMIRLSPTGSCWPTEDGTTWVTLLDALAQEFARVDASAVDLLNEAFPDTTDALLENWERILGLPDIFSDPDATVEERRNTVLFKIRARGGQSADYFEDLIEALGYESRVSDIEPFSADYSYAGDFLFDDYWEHHFLVLVEGPVSNEALFEARFQSVQPAHTISIFYYEDEV